MQQETQVWMWDWCIGGIDLHSEWASCLNFAFYQRAFFREKGFKSAHFDHEFLKDSNDGEEEAKAIPDFATIEAYKFENDRHRVIVAMLISDFFLFIMKHFKSNHVI
jgi:hypothetical protein